VSKEGPRRMFVGWTAESKGQGWDAARAKRQESCSARSVHKQATKGGKVS